MRSRYLAFVRATLAATLLAAAALATAASHTLLVFGDSLSAAYGIAPQQGWVQLLAERVRKASLPW